MERVLHREGRGAFCRGALVVACFAAIACAHRVELNDVGTSHVAPEAPSGARSPKPAPTGPWEHVADLAKLVPIDSRAIPSLGHHPPTWTGQVRVSSGSATVYRDPPHGTAFAEGTILVEGHTSYDGNTLPTYAMVKRESGFDGPGGDWEYLVLDDDGSLESRGILPACARCHADAPTDHTFGPRGPSRSAAVEPTPATSGSVPVEDEARAPDEADAPASTKGAKVPKKHR